MAKRGRPTKYKKEYCEMLVKHMAQGLSFESFGGVIEVDKVTLYNWAEQHDEFFNAKKIGFQKCRVFWEKLGVAIAAGKIQGNTGVWVFNMKNRFRADWKDKHEIEVSEIKPSIIERSNGDQVILDVTPTKQIGPSDDKDNS